MCYPAVVVIGDVIAALQSGRYDPEHTSVLLTQTFGQCRASNYVPLMRKALLAAGFGGVPVLSISAGDGGLQLAMDADIKELVKRLAQA
jgi:predicted nucleotide-binding protein (sugar kinase/HSP70/actin superfamily)